MCNAGLKAYARMKEEENVKCFGCGGPVDGTELLCDSCDARSTRHQDMAEEAELKATAEHLFGPCKPSPREATPEELDKIMFAILDHDSLTGNGCGPSFDMASTHDALEQARVCIFDEYITDGPGYYGRVAVVVWSGGPEIVTVLALDRKEGDLVTVEAF